MSLLLQLLRGYKPTQRTMTMFVSCTETSVHVCSWTWSSFALLLCRVAHWELRRLSKIHRALWAVSQWVSFIKENVSDCKVYTVLVLMLGGQFRVDHQVCTLTNRHSGEGGGFHYTTEKRQQATSKKWGFGQHEKIPRCIRHRFTSFWTTNSNTSI